MHPMVPDLARVLDEAHKRQLPALIEAWRDTRARRWIARALRIDLALLTAAPELVVPCLVRRCLWPGSSDEAAWYRERPAIPDDMLAVRELMAEWLAAWRPDRRWLRALRPPEVALDGGVVEEYRTSAVGPLHADRDRVSIGGAIGWERATGHNMDPHPMTVHPPWELVASAPGRFAIESAGRRIEHATEALARSVIVLEPPFVMVAGDEQYWLVDLEHAKVRWQAAGECIAAVADRAHVYVASRSAIERRSLASGDRRASWNAPAPSELALAGPDFLASRTGDVIRVWNLDEAVRRNSCAITGVAPPAAVTARDGVLRVGDAAIPVDRAELAVSADGRQFSSAADHLELV
jgi:hypothetical protein